MAIILSFKDRIKSQSIISRLEEETTNNHLVSQYTKVAKLFLSLNIQPLEKNKTPLPFLLSKKKPLSNRFILSDPFLSLGYLGNIVASTNYGATYPQDELRGELRAFSHLTKDGCFYAVMKDFLYLLLNKKVSFKYNTIDKETQKGQIPIVLAFFSLGLARRKLCLNKQNVVRWEIAEATCHLKQAKESYYNCMMQEAAYNIIQLMDELEGGRKNKSENRPTLNRTSGSLKQVGYEALLDFPSRLLTYNSVEEAAYGALLAVVNITFADRGLILLREHSNGLLSIKAIHGFVLPTPNSKILNLNEIELEANKKDFQICWSALERAVREKTYVIIGHETTDVSIKQQHSFLSSNMCSIIALPIIWRNQLYGVIYLDSSHNPYMPSVHPITLFQAFAMQFALYYENFLMVRGQKMVSYKDEASTPKKEEFPEADAA